MDLLSWTFGGPNPKWDKQVLVDAANPARSLTYRQTLRLVRQLIAGFRAFGVVPGDTVVVSSFNDILYYPVYFAVLGCGARFTGVNPSYTPHELVHHLTLTRAQFIIAEPKLLDNMLKAGVQCGIPEDRVILLTGRDKARSEHARFKDWTWLLEHGEQNWVHVADPYETVATYASTSGTTGLPKAALISHAYHVAQAELRIPQTAVPYEVRRLTSLPPFHAFATPIVPASIRGQDTTYVMARFEVTAFLTHLRDYQITETYIPTPILVTLPQHPLCTSDTLKSLRQVWVAGAASRLENQSALYSRLDQANGAQVNQVWGMTESGWITAAQWPDRLTDDSVGYLLDGFEAIVLDEKDQPVPEGEHGELLIRSPTLLLGYQSNARATKEAFTYLPLEYTASESKLKTCPVTGARHPTGKSVLPPRSPRKFHAGSPWLRTGDVGCIKNGRVFIVDRKKDLIKVRGWQVSSAEVECAIMTCPGVSDAAVIGVGIGRTDEHARAFVVRQPNSSDRVEAEDVKAWVAKKLAKYKIPQEVVFIQSIPKNSTGKILRQTLREMTVSAEAGSGSSVWDVLPPTAQSGIVS